MLHHGVQEEKKEGRRRVLSCVEGEAKVRGEEQLFLAGREPFLIPPINNGEQCIVLAIVS